MGRNHFGAVVAGDIDDGLMANWVFLVRVHYAKLWIMLGIEVCRGIALNVYTMGSYADTWIDKQTNIIIIIIIIIFM